MKQKTFLEIIALLFIVLFVYTGVSKFLDFERFKLVIQQTALLKPYSALIKWIIPLAEIVIAMTLAIPRYRLKGFYASFVLMVAFTVYVGSVLKFMDHLPCSCGGIVEEMSWIQHLFFNIAFSFLALIAIWLNKWQNKRKENDSSIVVYS